MDIKTNLQDRKQLDEFLRRFNELRCQFPDVEFNSESGFEAVEFSVGNQTEYVSTGTEK